MYSSAYMVLGGAFWSTVLIKTYDHPTKSLLHMVFAVVDALKAAVHFPELALAKLLAV